MKVKIEGLDKQYIVRDELVKAGVSLTSPVNVAIALTTAINRQIAEFEKRGEKVISVSFCGGYEPVFIMEDGE